MTAAETDPGRDAGIAASMRRVPRALRAITPAAWLAPILVALLLTLGAAQRTAAQEGEEVPFITTPDQVTLAMLQMAAVRRGDHVIDLGSGDGRIVITAAKRFGATGLGVEIVPDLVAKSRRAAVKAGVASRVEFREQDLFQADLSRASVITMYLLPEVNLKLRPALLALAPGTRIVSHDWDMGDWQPDETLTMDVPDKAVGREKFSRVHRWTVPARADGLWCGAARPRGTRVSLRIEQRFQRVDALWREGRRERRLLGRLDGRRLQLMAAGAKPLSGRVDEQRLVLAGARTLQRATGIDCNA